MTPQERAKYWRDEMAKADAQGRVIVAQAKAKAKTARDMHDILLARKSASAIRALTWTRLIEERDAEASPALAGLE